MDFNWGPSKLAMFTSLFRVCPEGAWPIEDDSKSKRILAMQTALYTSICHAHQAYTNSRCGPLACDWLELSSSSKVDQVSTV